MDWGFALAGGGEAVARAYSEERKNQRAFNLKEKQADADLARKENFARFGQTLSQENTQHQADVALTSFKDQHEIKEGYEMSGYVDPDTKQELTKAELKSRGSAEGLVPKGDFDAEQKTGRAIKDKGTKREAEIEAIKERYKDDPAKAEAAIDRLYGLSVSERDTGEMSASDIRKEADRTKVSAKRAADKVKEEGHDDDIAQVIGMQKELQYIDNPKVLDKLKGNKVVKNAVMIPKLADKLGKYRTEREIRNAYSKGEIMMGKNKVPKTMLDLAIKYRDYQGVLQDSKWWRPND